MNETHEHHIDEGAQAEADKPKRTRTRSDIDVAMSDLKAASKLVNQLRDRKRRAEDESAAISADLDKALSAHTEAKARYERLTA